MASVRPPRGWREQKARRGRADEEPLRMPLRAFAAATGLREVPEQGLPGPLRGPAPGCLAWSRTRRGSS